MRFAVVNQLGKVENVIMGDGEEREENGKLLVPLNDDSRIDHNWSFDFDERKFSKIVVEKPLGE